MKTIKKHILDYILWFFGLPRSFCVAAERNPIRNVVYIIVSFLLIYFLSLIFAK